MVEFLLGIGVSSACWYLIACAISKDTTSSKTPTDEVDVVIESEWGLVVTDTAGVKYTFKGDVRIRKVQVGYVLERKSTYRGRNLPRPVVSWHTLMTMPEEKYREAKIPHYVRAN